MKNIFAIVHGDPISINTEIIAKTWMVSKNRRKFFVIGNYDLIDAQLKKIKIRIPLNKIANINSKIDREKLNILQVPIIFKDPYKIYINETKIFIKKCIDVAHALAIKKQIKGFINCPINKSRFLSNNFGVTEYLAKKNKLNNSEVMLLSGSHFSVSPITTHIPVKDISKKLNKIIIIKKIRTMNFFYKKLFKKKPLIAILGLNPHNGENNKKLEENKIIIPAINVLKKEKINLYGPFPADTIMFNKKKFDIIVGMYHDQILPIFKSLHKFDAINITCGLKYIRVSPDHGTAENLIFKKKANTTSLENCIDFLNKVNV